MNTEPTNSKLLLRDEFLRLIVAASEVGSTRFQRQAAMHWLAVYPGDMEARLWLAKSLVAENNIADAKQILNELIAKDPQNTSAYSVLSHLPGLSDKELKTCLANLAALDDSCIDTSSQPVWVEGIRNIRNLIKSRQFDLAEQKLNEILGADEDPLLVAVYHVLLLHKKQEYDQLQHLADLYQSRWADCLQFKIILADALMQSHNESKAMSLLHQTISVDSLGQVAARIWNESNPYQSLWPKKFEVVLISQSRLRLMMYFGEISWVGEVWQWMIYKTAWKTHLLSTVNILMDMPIITWKMETNPKHSRMVLRIPIASTPIQNCAELKRTLTNRSMSGLSFQIWKLEKISHLQIGLTCLHRWKRVKKPRA